MIGNLLNFLKKSNLYFLRKSVTAEFDERQYLFLKRLCQVLVTLGEVQLFHLWVRVKITFKKHPFFVKLRSFLINLRFQLVCLRNIKDNNFGSVWRLASRVRTFIKCNCIFLGLQNFGKICTKLAILVILSCPEMRRWTWVNKHILQKCSEWRLCTFWWFYEWLFLGQCLVVMLYS